MKRTSSFFALGYLIIPLLLPCLHAHLHNSTQTSSVYMVDYDQLVGKPSTNVAVQEPSRPLINPLHVRFCFAPCFALSPVFACVPCACMELINPLLQCLCAMVDCMELINPLLQCLCAPFDCRPAFALEAASLIVVPFVLH